MSTGPTYKADPAFLTLADGFADEVAAAQFPKATLRYRNDRAAQSIGLDSLSEKEWLAHFGAFKPLPKNLKKPLAQKYHGHQFRNYNPDIGDGRGFLYAQMRDTNGRLMDLGTKGSGTTPYSRGGDGKLTLKGAVREILATEMLEALGVNTSKTLSVIETGESLHRGDEPSPTRSAVMVRLNHGHIRIGTFQHHAYFSDAARLESLIDYCLTHYFDITPTGSVQDRAVQFLGLVGERVAVQSAEIMAAGFIHGVLNTDNINITGEVFDFGPWRFLPTMDLTFTAAYFDHSGLYSFGRQPEALHWNVYQLGGALADVAEEAALKEALADFPQLYLDAVGEKLLARLGVKPKSAKENSELLSMVNDFLLGENFPYERFFFDWFGGSASEKRAAKSPEAERYNHDAYGSMKAALLQYEPANTKALDAPYFKGSGPCTILIEEVESLWAAIDKQDDWQPLYDKIEAIREMGEALNL